MYKLTALQMLMDPPEKAQLTSCLELDIFNDKKLIIDVKFYSYDKLFIVTFDSEQHQKLNKLFFQAGREEHTPSQANAFVHKIACDFISAVLGELFEQLMESREMLSPDFQTAFIGVGVPACLAVMVAASSPPHNLVTFGMPGFSSERPFKEIMDKALDRKRRHGSPAELPINSSYYVSPFTDGTYKAFSDYFRPHLKVVDAKEPSLLTKLFTGLTSFKRKGINLKAYANPTL